jgi:hypothetical protein
MERLDESSAYGSEPAEDCADGKCRFSNHFGFWRTFGEAVESEPACQSRPGTATQGKRQPVESFARTGSCAVRSAHRARERLGEDLPPATVANAEELPGLEQDHHRQTFPWKVGQLPLIVAMDSARSRSTRRACRDAATSTQLHLDRPILRAKTD